MSNETTYRQNKLEDWDLWSCQIHANTPMELWNYVFFNGTTTNGSNVTIRSNMTIGVNMNYDQIEVQGSIGSNEMMRSNWTIVPNVTIVMNESYIHRAPFDSALMAGTCTSKCIHFPCR